MSGALTIDFAGEIHRAEPGDRITVGRAGTIAIEDNPYLHREFLLFHHVHDNWWVENVGSRLAALVADTRRTIRSTLSSGAKLPIVVPEVLVTFTAGTTLYELNVALADLAFEDLQTDRVSELTGQSTIGPGAFTASQLMCILALAEPFLRNPGTGLGEVPSAIDAAHRLGWGQSKFTRKLDNVCGKLAASGVSGLLPGKDGSAQNRRINLVEYAVSTLLVTAADLPLLDAPSPTEHAEGGANETSADTLG